MKCPKCNNKHKEIAFKNDDDFEYLDEKHSNSNWDNWDFWLKIRCKKCGHIFEFEQ